MTLYFDSCAQSTKWLIYPPVAELRTVRWHSSGSRITIIDRLGCVNLNHRS